VENASHHVERGLRPREATIRAMSEVTGPVISITLVLMAVFIPTAFLTGITGQMYRQFALTIAATAVISAVNALTLKPAQCASYLRPHTGRNLFTRLFDFVYRPVEATYAWVVRQSLKVWPLVLLVFVGVAAGTGWWYMNTPTGFLPTEDEGYVIVAVQLPDAASLDRTREVTDRMNKVFEKYRANGSVENCEGVGLETLQERTQAVIDAAGKRPEIAPPPAIRSTFRAGVPQVYLNIDRVKAEKMGVPISDVFAALQANLGSVYVNDFNKFDRTYQVRVQAEARFRGDPGLIRRLEVHNRDGGRVPLATLC